MIRLAFAAFFVTVSFDASAIVRYMVQGMTCAQVREALDRDGAAILFRPGQSGIPLYDRFVADESFCAAGSLTAAERITTADTDNCKVTKCVEALRFGD